MADAEESRGETRIADSLRSCRPWTSRLWLALAFAPIVALAALVDANGVNVPWQDQWELVPLLEKAHNGTLAVADLFAQHNEHRILIPRLVMLGLARVTGWNTRQELWVSLGLALTVFAVLGWFFARTRQLVEPDFRPGLVVAAAWLYFSPAQWENWLWGWQVQWFLDALCLVTAVWALCPRERALPGWRLAIAAAAAFCASFSLGAGLLVWIACILPLLFVERRRTALACWTAAALATWLVYFATYIPAPGRAPWLTALQQPGELAVFWLACLGSAFFMSYRLAAAAGALLTVLLGVSVWRLVRLSPERARFALPWLTVAARSMLEAGSIAVTRLGFGLAAATSSRYALVSVLFALPVAFLAATALSSSESGTEPAGERRKGIAFGAGLALLAAATAAGYSEGVGQMANHRARLIRAVILLASSERTVDPRLAAIYPDLPRLPDRIRFLRQVGWGGFRKLR